VKQYRGFLAWREAERIDEVLDEPLYEPEVEIELSRMSMRLIEVGNDLQDRPVMMAHLGNVDLQAAKKSHGITVGMMVRRHAKALEQLVRRIEESKTPLAGHLLIFNLANCTLSKFWHAWGYIREVAHMGQAYYPELLGKLCFVNGPVKAFWAIEKVKLLLNQATRDKVSVSSGDPTSLLESLLPPSTALPASFGLEWPSEAAGETVAGEAVAGEAVAGEAVAGVKTAGEADKDTERSKMTAVASTERTESGRESVVVAAMEVAAAEKEETAAAEAESENAPTDPAMPQASDGYVPPPPLPWLTEIVMLRIGDGHSSGSGDQVEYNGSSSFPIETDFFSGMCHVRLRGLPGEPEEYFAGKKRQQSTVVQGRVKRPLQMSECSTGFEWHAPLRHMPRPLFLKPILKFFRTIAPAITIDVLSDRPLVLNPLFNAVQRLHVALPGEQPEITSPFEEETTLLGGAFATKPLGWKDRKRMFASRASLPYTLDPAHVVTMELYEDKLIPTTFELVVGPIRVSLLPVLGAGTALPQPLMTIGKLGYEPMSCGAIGQQYLFNIELWHASLLAPTPALASAPEQSAATPRTAVEPLEPLPQRRPRSISGSFMKQKGSTPTKIDLTSAGSAATKPALGSATSGRPHSWLPWKRSANPAPPTAVV